MSNPVLIGVMPRVKQFCTLDALMTSADQAQHAVEEKLKQLLSASPSADVTLLAAAHLTVLLIQCLAALFFSGFEYSTLVAAEKLTTALPCVFFAITGLNAARHKLPRSW